MSWIFGNGKNLQSSKNRGVTRKKTRLFVETLEDRCVPTVIYYGGNLLANVEAQALYYGSEWSSASNGNLRKQLVLRQHLQYLYVNRFASAVRSSRYQALLAC